MTSPPSRMVASAVEEVEAFSRTRTVAVAVPVAAALAVTVEPKITAAAAATAAVFFQTEWNCNVFPSVLPSLRFRTYFLLPDHYTGRPPIFQQFRKIATTSLQLFRGPDKYIKFLLPV